MRVVYLFYMMMHALSWCVFVWHDAVHVLYDVYRVMMHPLPHPSPALSRQQSDLALTLDHTVRSFESEQTRTADLMSDLDRLLHDTGAENVAHHTIATRLKGVAEEVIAANTRPSTGDVQSEEQREMTSMNTSSTANAATSTTTAISTGTSTTTASNVTSTSTSTSSSVFPSIPSHVVPSVT